jgi:hypothetical protein
MGWTALLAVMAARVSRRFFFLRFRLLYCRVFIEIGEPRGFFVIKFVVRLDDVVEPLANRLARPTCFRARCLSRFRTKASQVPRTARFHSHAKTCLGIRMCLIWPARMSVRVGGRYPVSPAIEI